MSYFDHPHATYSVRHVFGDGTMIRSTSGNMAECKRQFGLDVMSNVTDTHLGGKTRIVLYHEHKEFPVYELRLNAKVDWHRVTEALQRLTEATERAVESADESTVNEHVEALRHARSVLDQVGED